MMFPPRRTGKPVESVSLVNKLIPWNGKQPVLVDMSCTETLYLPVFSEIERLRAFMKEAKSEYDSIKMIDDPRFVQENRELLRDLKIMLDPVAHPDGRIVYVEILADSDQIFAN